MWSEDQTASWWVFTDTQLQMWQHRESLWTTGKLTVMLTLQRSGEEVLPGSHLYWTLGMTETGREWDRDMHTKTIRMITDISWLSDDYCQSNQLFFSEKSPFFVFVFAFGFIDRTVEDVTGNRMSEREGEWHTTKGPRPGLEPGALCCSEDKASVHGAPAPPTELNSTPESLFLKNALCLVHLMIKHLTQSLCRIHLNVDSVCVLTGGTDSGNSQWSKL